MAGEGERMQLRSMVDKDKEDNWSKGATHHDGERSENTETSTTKPTHEGSDGLDDIYRAIRVSNRGVRKFWYIPDLKNTQLKTSQTPGYHTQTIHYRS